MIMTLCFWVFLFCFFRKKKQAVWRSGLGQSQSAVRGLDLLIHAFFSPFIFIVKEKNNNSDIIFKSRFTAMCLSITRVVAANRS